MAISTVYDVRLRYLLDDKASKGIKNLNEAAGLATKSTGSLGSTLKRVALIAGGVFGFRKAKEVLVDYNSFMEQARLRTAGLLSIAKETDLADQLGNANKIMGELQERAKTSTATTQEFVAFMADIVQPASQAGLATKDIAKFTAQAVVAAKAFGDEQIAAFDIQQALTKGVTIRDRFAVKLLGLQSEEARQAFNQLSAQERLLKIQEKLAAPQIRQLAEAQATSFAGLFSTLKDNFQIILGKVGAPLFKRLTQEAQKAVDFLSQNGEMVNRMAERMGNAIVEGFIRAKTVFLGIVDVARDIATLLSPVFFLIKEVLGLFTSERRTIVLLAKGFLAFKAAKGLVGFGQALKKGFGGLATKANLAAAAVGLMATGIQALADGMLEGQEKRLKAQNQLKFFRDELQVATDVLPDILAGAQLGGGKGATLKENVQLASLVRQAQESNLLDKEGNVNLIRIAEELLGVKAKTTEEASFLLRMGDKQSEANALILQLTQLSEFASSERFKQAQEQIRLQKSVKDAVISGNQAIMKVTLSIAQAQINAINKSLGLPPIQIPGATSIGAVGGSSSDKQKGGPRVNVTINNLEVQSDDPDRLVFGMISAFQDAARNPNSAVDSFKFREGG